MTMNDLAESAPLRSKPTEISPPFACSRCWKRKKKCDRAIPQCQRCASASVLCTYASQPPCTGTARYTDRNGAEPPLGAVKGLALLSVYPPSFSCLTQSVHTILNYTKAQLGAVCSHYLLHINIWVPIVPDDQLTKRLENLSSDLDLATGDVLLLLCIYLVTDATSFAVSLSMTSESLYHVIKHLCSAAQTFQDPCTSIVRSFMLISLYEQGQCMRESAYLTIGACARMGYALGWHKTLDENHTPTYISEAVQKEQRTSWWCIIVLERMFTLDSASPPGYSSPCAIPKLSTEDLLPGISQSESQSLSLTVGETEASPSWSFTLGAATHPFARTAQATYLLSCVFEHFSEQSRTSEDWYREADRLDDLIQSFMLRTLEQSSRERQNQWHHACTAYYICTCALLYLHKHHLSIGYSQKDATAHENLLRQKSNLTLQAMSRSVMQKSEYLTGELFAGEKFCPPLGLSYFRDAALFSIDMSSQGENKEIWVENKDFLIDCLAMLGKRWDLARSFLDEINAATATIISV